MERGSFDMHIKDISTILISDYIKPIQLHYYVSMPLNSWIALYISKSFNNVYAYILKIGLGVGLQDTITWETGLRGLLILKTSCV